MRAEWVKTIRRATVKTTQAHFLPPATQGQIGHCPVGTWQPVFSSGPWPLLPSRAVQWSESIKGNHYQYELGLCSQARHEACRALWGETVRNLPAGMGLEGWAGQRLLPSLRGHSRTFDK